MNWFKRLFSTCPPIDAPEIELNKSSLPPNFTVLDIETTGLNPKKNEILEIGAIRYRGGFEARHFHTYVRPSRPIPEYISDINGITWDIVSGAPVFAQIKDRFFSFIGNDTLVGYNILFDIRFIQYYSQHELTNPLIDVLQIARHSLPGESCYKLDYLRRKYNLGGKAHSALGDCEATKKLFQLCCNSVNMSDELLYVSERPKLQLHTQAQFQTHFISVETLAQKHPLLLKKVVLTGEFESPRYKLGGEIQKVGGCVSGTVSTKTDYLVIGSSSGIPTSKEKQARYLNSEKNAHIQIITEHELLALIKSES